MIIDKLSFYMIRSFFKSAVFLVVGLTSLLMLFDLLANAEQITEHNHKILEPFMHYMGLRLPDIVVLVLPLAALMASLQTIVQKVSSHEIVIMRAAGVPSYRIAYMLVAGGLILMVMQFLMMNFVQVKTAKELQRWEKNDFRMQALYQPDEQVVDWIVVGNDLIDIGSSSVDGKLLNDIQVIKRDGQGQMQSYLQAVQAVWRDGEWTLFDVYIPAIGRLDAANHSELSYDLGITPALFSKLADRSVEWTLWDLYKNVKSQQVQDQPDYVYSLWLHRKVAGPMGVLVMVLLAMPVAIQIARNKALAQHVFLTIMAGFGFFILERLCETVGTVGELPPMVAAWSPAALYVVMSGWLLLMREGR